MVLNENLIRVFRVIIILLTVNLKLTFSNWSNENFQYTTKIVVIQQQQELTALKPQQPAQPKQQQIMETDPQQTKISNQQQIPTNQISFNYIGCFNDRREMRDIGDKDYSYVTKFNKSMPTVELCVQLCAQDDFKIAGIQAFDECYCGNTYGRYNSTFNSSCFFQCAGKYTCGGYNANSVYLISRSSNVAQPTIKSKDIERINSVDIQNPCLSSPCLNSGMCITLMDDQGTPRGYLCRCNNPMDSGMYCEDRNFCFSNPCLNGATCRNNLNSYTCECVTGWSGFNCNNPSQLVNLNSNCFDEGKRCLNGGSCLKYDNEFFFSCKCPPNYYGTTCENYDICLTKPCKNNGTCVAKSPTYYECNCKENYYGATCENLNPCSNVTCANGGICRIDYTKNEYYCLCTGNFAGKNCDKCLNGYSGPTCNQLLSYCSPNPCINGHCNWHEYGFVCVCSEGWYGKNCSEKNCLLKPCLNGGICKGLNSINDNQIEYKCNCPAGFYGEICEFQDNEKAKYLKTSFKVITRTNPNDNDLKLNKSKNTNDVCNNRVKCQNNADCIPLTELNSLGFKCLCKDNFTGLFCETIIPEINRNDSITTKTNKSYETLNPLNNDKCKNMKCLNNGTCVESILGSAQCSCDLPFYGDFCQFKDECYSNPCGINGLCFQLPNNTYACKCNKNYYGTNCNFRSDKNDFNVYSKIYKFQNSEKDCSKTHCNNNGYCIINIDKYSSGHENNLDQIPNIYTCNCFSSKTGPNCESDVDPCLSSPCSKNEDCVQSNDGTSSYICVHSSNFCEIMKPCNNNSECVYSKENNTFYCQCKNDASSCQNTVVSSTQILNDKNTIETLMIGTASSSLNTLISSTQILNKTNMETMITSASSNENTNSVSSDSKTLKDIPKIGFNYDNLYWLLPLALVVFVIILFISIVTYYGIKARSRIAKFNQKSNNIRNINIQYVNDTMPYEENLKPIPSVSHSSISYSNHSPSEKEYAEGYGRV